jgi:hypothetical protein
MHDRGEMIFVTGHWGLGPARDNCLGVMLWFAYTHDMIPPSITTL